MQILIFSVLLRHPVTISATKPPNQIEIDLYIAYFNFFGPSYPTSELLLRASFLCLERDSNQGLWVSVYLNLTHALNRSATMAGLLTLLNIHNSLVCKLDLNHSCFSPAQVILIPLLTLLNIRNSLVCMLVILSVMARHIVKAFAFEPWMFYLGNF